MISWAVFATSVITPLWVQRSGHDIYRGPKIAVFLAGVILVAALLAYCAIHARPKVLAATRRHRLDLGVALAGLTWIAVTSATSTNWALSRGSLAMACAVFVFFAGGLVGFSGRSPSILLVFLIPATLNGALAILQRMAVWNPFEFEPEYTLHLRTVAFVGNPNFVGSYLIIPAVAAVAGAIAWQRHRAKMAVSAVVLIAGLLASESMSAIVALMIALLLILFTAARGTGIAALATVLAMTLILLLYTPVRDRVVRITRLAERGNFFELTTRRTPAFMVAWSMFRERPGLGFGPGTFRWWYMPLKMDLDLKHRELRRATDNFGEVHNDHLQILAESGLPGYLLFAGGLCAFGMISRRQRGRTDDRARFLRVFCLPAAGALFVICLAQFPLRLPASLVTNTALAACCVSWHRDESFS